MYDKKKFQNKSCMNFFIFKILTSLPRNNTAGLIKDNECQSSFQTQNNNEKFLIDKSFETESCQNFGSRLSQKIINIKIAD